MLAVSKNHFSGKPIDNPNPEIQNLFKNHQYREAFRKAADALSFEETSIVAKVNYALLVRNTLLAIKSFAKSQIEDPFKSPNNYDFIDLYSCLNSTLNFVQKNRLFEDDFCLALAEAIQIPRLKGIEIAILLEVEKSYAQLVGAEEQAQNLKKIQFSLLANPLPKKDTSETDQHLHHVNILLKQVEKLVGSRIPSVVCNFILYLSEKLIDAGQLNTAIEILEELKLFKIDPGDKIKLFGQLIYARLQATGESFIGLITQLQQQINEAKINHFDPQSCEILTRTLVALDDPALNINTYGIASKFKMQIDSGLSCPPAQQVALDLCIARSEYLFGRPEIAIAQLKSIESKLLDTTPSLRLLAAEISASSYHRLFCQANNTTYYREALSSLQECIRIAKTTNDQHALARAFNKLKYLTSPQPVEEPKETVSK